MPRRLSGIIGIDHKKLDKKGVFDSFVDIDSKLHFDPSLLNRTRIKEFKKSHAKLRKHFTNLVKVIEKIKNPGDIFWKAALKNLQFKEESLIGLGYAKTSKEGSGIGRNLALSILETSKLLIDEGIKDPEIFELVGIFEEGIGADRISDMTISIIKDDILKYTARVAKELKIRTTKQLGFQLPLNPKTGDPIIFVPKDFLRDLPMAYSWSDIDLVCMYNMTLRLSINKEIGKTWRVALRTIKKRDLRDLIIRQPEVLKDLIQQYKDKDKLKYDFAKDPAGEVIWAEYSERAAKEFPINLKQFLPLSNGKLIELAKVICVQFEQLMENNGWSEFLYDSNGKLRNERFPQKLFYGIADQYCIANDLDLSREVNAGSGALDFKISKGSNFKVSIEVKYSSNPSLVKGFTNQLPTYNKAEKIVRGVYLVIQTTESNKQIKKLNMVRDDQLKVMTNVPELVIIDGTRRKSASRR